MALQHASVLSLSEQACHCALLAEHMEFIIMRSAAGACREQCIQLYQQLAAQQRVLLAEMRVATMETFDDEHLGERVVCVGPLYWGRAATHHGDDVPTLPHQQVARCPPPRLQWICSWARLVCRR